MAFIDQSHRISVSVTVAACALTSVKFRPVNGGTSNDGITNSNFNPIKKSIAGSSHFANSISVANFTQNVTKQQLIAIGDQIGNLHVLEIPRTLSRASAGEKQAME